MKFLALFAILFAAVSALVVDHDIDLAFSRNETLDIFLHFPQYVESEFSTQQVLSRPEARTRVRELRREHNAKFQPSAIVLLKALGFEFRTFWISNSILVKSVSAFTYKTLLVIPNIVELEANKDTAYIIDPMVHSQDDEAPNVAEWNVNIIRATEAWAQTRGEGVVVANIDTGVRFTHEAVNLNYRGNLGGSYDHDYNWHDPRNVQRQPYDNNGHGTHTMGTLAGSDKSGVGVAPGSKWIAAKGCASSSCATADLLSSAEYVLCPTRQDGSGEDCGKGADLVSNSWGGGRGSSTYLTVVQAWVAAGIVPLFSQGNSGSSCSTANSPGDLGIVIGVGSTNRNDALSSFSSRGPGVGTANHPLQKPDISAPGEQVRSAYYTGDTAYATLSGTSMACPAAAGVTALLLSKNPRLTVPQVVEILTKTAVNTRVPPNGGTQTCGGVSYTVVPNYHYGYGRIDAVNVLAQADKY